MKSNRLNFYLVLTLLFFSPFFWVIKWLKEDVWFFWGLVVWTSIAYGLFLALLNFYEKQFMKIELEPTSVSKSSEDIDSDWVNKTTAELEELLKKEHRLESQVDQLKQDLSQKEKEFIQSNLDLQSQLDKKETILSEYRSTLQEQRKVIEKKQDDIHLLQNRVDDQKKELESLLKLKTKQTDQIISYSDIESQLEEINSPSFDEPTNLLDSIQDKLERYVKMAAKLNSSHHLMNKKQMQLQLPLGSLMVDQRRLFDRLQNEESEIILVYSREDKKLLFINEQVKEVLGWTPERFIKDFSYLIQKDYLLWRRALEEIKTVDQKNFRLMMKAKSGKEVLTHCYLKEVPDGVFKGYVLGMLSSPARGA